MSKDESLPKFRAFEFDGNEEWSRYLKNVEIVGPDRDNQLLKLKARWYKKNMDPSFDLQWVASAAAPTQRAPAPQPSKPSAPYTAPSSTTPPNFASYGRPPPPAGRTATDAQTTMLFVMHISILVLTLAFMQPVYRSISTLTYRYLLMAIIATQGYKIYVRNGYPAVLPIMPFDASWQRNAPWLAKVLPSTDFHYMMLPLAFLGVQPMLLLVIPPAVLAVYHVAAHASANFSNTPMYQMLRIEMLHGYLASNQEGVTQANAGLEVALGFTLIMTLLTPARAIIVTFFYWNMLKARYHTSDVSDYHKKVWRMLDDKCRPIYNMAPMLQMPIGYIQNWFLTPQ
jgi:hypothetical protein